jgi:anti-sigma factor RsiW
MRCAHVLPLVERFADGELDPVMMRRVAEHAHSCPRCSAHISSARSMVAALAAAPKIFAPDGFLGLVMDGVYRQALATPSAPAAAARSGASAASRFYRRLGLSLVLTAGVLAMSLLLPRAAYTALVGAGVESSRGSSITVKGALDGAGSTVRGILGESPRGGEDR